VLPSDQVLRHLSQNPASSSPPSCCYAWAEKANTQRGVTACPASVLGRYLPRRRLWLERKHAATTHGCLMSVHRFFHSGDADKSHTSLSSRVEPPHFSVPPPVPPLPPLPPHSPPISITAASAATTSPAAFPDGSPLRPLLGCRLRVPNRQGSRSRRQTKE